MAVATFDTLKFANTLKAAGVPPAQAEAEAAAFSEVMQLNLKELVAKDDLAAAEKGLKQEAKEVEQRLSAKIDLLALQHKSELQVLRWMVGIGTTVSVAMIGIVLRLLLTRPG